MSEQEIKKKAEALKEKFLEAVDIAAHIDEKYKDTPDAVYFIALNLLVNHNESDTMFQDAKKLVEHIKSEQTRLKSN